MSLGGRLVMCASAPFSSLKTRVGSFNENVVRRASRRLRGVYREWPVVTDSEGRGLRNTETASSKTDCTRDSALSVRTIGIARHREGAQSGARDAVSRVTLRMAATRSVVVIRGGHDRPFPGDAASD